MYPNSRKYIQRAEAAIIAAGAEFMDELQSGMQIYSLVSDWLQLHSAEIAFEEKMAGQIACGRALMFAGFDAQAVSRALTVNGVNLSAVVNYLFTHGSSVAAAGESDFKDECEEETCQKLVTALTGQGVAVAVKMASRGSGSSMTSLFQVLAKTSDDMMASATGGISSAPLTRPPVPIEHEFASSSSLSAANHAAALHELLSSLSTLTARQALYSLLSHLATPPLVQAEVSICANDSDEENEDSEAEKKADEMALAEAKAAAEFQVNVALAQSLLSRKLNGSSLLICLFRATMASPAQQDVDTLRAIFAKLISAEHSVPDEQASVTMALVTEAFVQLMAGVKDAELGNLTANTAPINEDTIMSGTRFSFFALRFILDLFLAKAQEHHTKLSNRLFPSTVMALLVRFVNVAESTAAVQFPMLETLGAVLQLPNHSYDASTTVAGLLENATSLYDRESSSLSPSKSFSPTLQSLTNLCLSLVDKFKAQGRPVENVPAWFQKIYEFKSLLAFLKCGQADTLTPELLSDLGGGMSAEAFTDLHATTPPGLDAELVQAVDRFESKSGNRT
jgi:hypothetical protein